MSASRSGLSVCSRAPDFDEPPAFFCLRNFVLNPSAHQALRAEAFISRIIPCPFVSGVSHVFLPRVFPAVPPTPLCAYAGHRVPVRPQLPAGVALSRPETSLPYPPAAERRSALRLTGSPPDPASSDRCQKRILSTT